MVVVRGVLWWFVVVGGDLAGALWWVGEFGVCEKVDGVGQVLWGR
jgi:hypothetical protein